MRMIWRKHFGSGQKPIEEGCVRIRQVPTEGIQVCTVGSGQTMMDSIVTDSRTADPRSIEILDVGDCDKRGHPEDHCLFVCRGCGELHDMGKCPMKEFYNQIRQWFNPTKHMGMLLEAAENMTLVRGGNLYEASVLDIASMHLCIYIDQVSKQRDLPDKRRDLHRNHTFAISSLRQADEYARSDVIMTKDEDLWFKPADQETTTEITKPERGVSTIRIRADIGSLTGRIQRILETSCSCGSVKTKIVGKIHNEKAILLLDTGAEVSIVDTAFACKVGCYIDSNQIQDCVGIGDNVYRTEGRTRIKVTLAGLLVYFFHIRVGDLAGHESILGMDFMVPVGIGLDLVHGSISLPDEREATVYGDKARIMNLGQYLRIQPGESVELPLRLRASDHEKLWVIRGDHWVPTIGHGPGKVRYMRITNVGDQVLILHQDLRIGIWLAGDHVPRLPGFISVGSRSYIRWQNLALEATVDPRSAGPDPDAEDPPRPADYDECIYYHEGSDLYAEDVDGQLAVLPEVPATTEDVRIEDIQVCGSDNQTPEEIDRLRKRIWKFRHLLISKGNALPPAARGVACDIDVGGARPVALKCRKLRILFRENLAELIKGLLSAKMINH
ncbi:LOW QUALITY PROTEIN: hypothetical protein PHMEG_0006022 [Phytophthora megakarya]|uniref:Peptidase A2 domain-containing protein n=1 Tax=Phytophthora megakarya TaxID=4795 RepID=A0A225WPR8_9STRA|nr:LOW QUALITY PROTEIN: hypothetical protein PHMEG_0006022 [Phytophthora megakarya]